MTDLSDKTVIVYDRGLFMQVAERLGRDFKKVYYHNPAHKAVYPKFQDAMIGQGLKSENIEWLEHFWDIEADLYVFPDVHDGDLQLHLRSIGRRVWGSGKCEELELLRCETMEYLEELGLPTPEYIEIKGLDALREHLKTHKNKYVKTDIYRGTFETFHAIDYKLSEPLLDKLEKELGPAKNLMTFSVFTPIDGVEVGYDGFCIDGKFPERALFGYEQKDIGYSGIVKEYSKLAPVIAEFNDKISETFKINKYRNFFSSEIRANKNDHGYMIDACCRQPSPLSECYYELMKNFSEILWHGADGVLIEPEYTAECVMTLCIESAWAERNWQAIYFPKEIRQWVKLRNYCKVDNQYYIVPVPDGSTTIGVIVAIGNSLEDCAEKVNSYAEQIEGYNIKMECAVTAKMEDVIKKGEAIGIKFD